jgi:hypothetical protein
MSIMTDREEMLKSPKTYKSINFLKTTTSGLFREVTCYIKISFYVLVTKTLLSKIDIT